MLNKQKLIDMCKKEVGYQEAPNGTNKYSEFMDTLGLYNGKKNGYAWCDCFVDCMFIWAYGLNYGWGMTYNGVYGAGCKESARYYKEAGQLWKSPHVGDQVFFNDPATHTGIVVEVRDNCIITVEGNTSNLVKMRTHYLDKEVMTFGRPRWDIDEGAHNEAEEWAIKNGLFVGDGNGNYDFNRPITRGELCWVLMALAKKFSS